jgi:hypothetical protein
LWDGLKALKSVINRVYLIVGHKSPFIRVPETKVETNKARLLDVAQLGTPALIACGKSLGYNGAVRED